KHESQPHGGAPVVTPLPGSVGDLRLAVVSDVVDSLARMRTNVYVDGFNLYYGCLKDTPYRWLDLDALFARMLPKNDVQRVRYFTARVAARPGKLHDPVHQNTYLRALATLPRVSIHLGHFLTKPATMPLANPPTAGPKFAEVLRTEEKGSDVNLATYLLADAFRRDAEAFVIVSNDSDLTEPMRIVCHELGMVVGILNPQPPQKRSRALLSCKPTFFKQIRASVLATSQFPPRLTDSNGMITKPVGW
ncbi:MAG: NYN domain-containing protein, partial [Pseudonocardiaceae bacterium]